MKQQCFFEYNFCEKVLRLLLIFCCQENSTRHSVSGFLCGQKLVFIILYLHSLRISGELCFYVTASKLVILRPVEGSAADKRTEGKVERIQKEYLSQEMINLLLFH